MLIGVKYLGVVGFNKNKYHYQSLKKKQLKIANTF